MLGVFVIAALDSRGSADKPMPGPPDPPSTCADGCLG